MSQRVWIVVVAVVAVLVFGYLLWPTGTGDGVVQPTDGSETSQPTDEPATTE